MWSRISISLLLYGVALFTIPVANAATEQAIVCKGCSYQQAKSLAISKAEPPAKCEDSFESEGQPKANCFSQPKNIVIFDALTRQAYPFKVYHANQGGSIRDLRASITTRDRAVHPTAIELLNTGVDMHTELMNSQDDITKRLVSDLNSGKIKIN